MAGYYEREVGFFLGLGAVFRKREHHVKEKVYSRRECS